MSTYSPQSFEPSFDEPVTGYTPSNYHEDPLGGIASRYRLYTAGSPVSSLSNEDFWDDQRSSNGDAEAYDNIHEETGYFDDEEPIMPMFNHRIGEIGGTHEYPLTLTPPSSAPSTRPQRMSAIEVIDYDSDDGASTYGGSIFDKPVTSQTAPSPSSFYGGTATGNSSRTSIASGLSRLPDTTTYTTNANEEDWFGKVVDQDGFLLPSGAQDYNGISPDHSSGFVGFGNMKSNTNLSQYSLAPSARSRLSLPNLKNIKHRSRAALSNWKSKFGGEKTTGGDEYSTGDYGGWDDTTRAASLYSRASGKSESRWDKMTSKLKSRASGWRN